MSAPPPVLMLDQVTVARLLSLDACIAAMEAAFAAQGRGETLAPALMHVDAERGEFHIKAGGIRSGASYFACKINGGFFRNRAEMGLPNILGLIVLSDADNGVPLAVMESGLITRLRTGATTAVAAKYLARPDSTTVTICGAGIQAEIHLRALIRVLPIRRAYIWSRGDADPLARRLTAELDIEIQATADLATAARTSDVILTCTPAKRWFLGCEHVRSGTFIGAVGADSPDKQELEPELMARAAVVPDLLRQAAICGELHHAVASGLMLPGQIRGELGAVVSGSLRGRLGPNEIVIYDSTGTALQDAAAAAVVYRAALDSGVGTYCDFWKD